MPKKNHLPKKNQPLAISEPIDALREQVIQGDPESISRLGGDLCHYAECFHAEVVSGGKMDMFTAIRAQLLVLRSDLGSDDVSPLERLLVDRLVTCWLTLHALEHEAAKRYMGAPTKPPTLDKAIDRGHRR